MKIPLSWIREFVEIDLTIDELAYKLTMAGLEVEEIHFFGLPLPGIPDSAAEIKAQQVEYKISGFEWARDEIVVGAVHEVLPHPNADRLVLCQLDDGAEVHTVLTGAPNLLDFRGIGPIVPPLKVCYAREGATIINAYEPGNQLTTLKRRKIRGIDSYSMACSERELGISEEHEGIILLDEDAPTGMPLQDYMGDAVLDIAITPNIARNANVLGVAREIAAILGVELRDLVPSISKYGDPITGRVTLSIPNPEINPRFVLGLIEGITIQPSPYKVQLRLALSGMRPINNIVDATNYAMHEIGEPLHAFDYDILLERAKSAGVDIPEISTRLAQPGETLKTLDGETRKLDEFTVLVCDQAGPLALAGVMGGAESEVHDHTQNVLLEGAAWNMINTRRTLMSQKLSSEAGYRFSRGVHPALAPLGVLQGLGYMQSWGGGKVSTGLVDAYPLPPNDPTVPVRPEDVSRWLGIDLTSEEIAAILGRLGFTTEILGEIIHAKTPDHRLDIGTGVVGVADLMEEIARIYGYENIPETRMADSLPPQISNPILELEERVRDLLVEAGLQEIITYRMTTPEAEAQRLPPETVPADKPYLHLENPMTSERSVLRQSLLASVLEIVERNIRFRDRIAVFEIGQIFLASEGGELPDEHTRLVIAITGNRTLSSWLASDSDPLDFYDLKGIVEGLLQGLHIDGATFQPGDHPSFHPGKNAHILLGDQRLGTLGEIHPQVAERYGLPTHPVLAARFNMEMLQLAVADRFETTPVPVYPLVIEDLALVVGDQISAAEVELLIRQTGGRMVTDVLLFDVYRGGQLGTGQKSLAYRISYQDPEKTLSDKDVARLRTKIVKRLERELGASLRDGRTD